MVTSLIMHERILTTHTKAKYCQRFADKMVAYARRNTPNARVKIGAFVKGEEATAKLFGVLAQRYASDHTQHSGARVQHQSIQHPISPCLLTASFSVLR